MKKKYIAIMLLVIGTILICLSIVLAIIVAMNKDVIGGADLPTVLFVLRHENKGVYLYLHLCGIISLIASAIIALKAKKHKNK